LITNLLPIRKKILKNPNSVPIHAIRRSYFLRIGIVFLCFLCAFAAGPVGYWFGIAGGFVIIFSAALVFGSMIWLAFTSLEYVCPRCLNNIAIDPSQPGRTLAWFSIFADPVICSNCKLNLSEPYKKES
jgi:hypothetical protein